MRALNIFYFWSLCFWAGLSPAFAGLSDSDQALCEAEIAHKTFLVEHQSRLIREGRGSEADLLRARGVLLDWKRVCDQLTEVAYQAERLANFAALRTQVEAEVNLGQSRVSEIARLDALVLDFRWKEILLSTLDYCYQKYKLLAAERVSAFARIQEGNGVRSEQLDVEAAIQHHREFCELEASIQLPPDEILSWQPSLFLP